MGDLDPLLSTIEAIHGAALRPADWPQALSSVATLLGGSAATLESYGVPGGSLQWLQAHGIPPANQLEYFEEFAALNPRAAYGMRQPEVQVLWDYKVLDEGAMDRDAYYSEFLPRTGFRYFLSGVVERTSSRVVVTTIQRSSRQGHVNDAEVALISKLLPHLRQSLDVSERLGVVQKADALRDAIDCLADGVALIGADGAVIHANRALVDIGARLDGISMGRSGLAFAASDATRAYAQALAAAASLEGSEFAVHRPAGTPSYVVAVRPFRAATQEGGDQVAALVFVHDPLQGQGATAQVLQSAFGLTAAESDLARALQRGVTPVAYARLRKVSINTVYTHLRRVKEKTGLSRLPELVALLDAMHSRLR